MLTWLWPVVALVAVLGLLAIGWRKSQQRHEAMTLIALGEIHRQRGAFEDALSFYEAARERGVGVPEVQSAIAQARDGSTEPMSDHPLVEDLERRLDDEPEEVRRWLADRGLAELGEIVHEGRGGEGR